MNRFLIISNFNFAQSCLFVDSMKNNKEVKTRGSQCQTKIGVDFSPLMLQFLRTS